MQHHRPQLLSVISVLASSAGVRWHGCLVQKAFPAQQCTAASASAVWVEPRRAIKTQARLSQQEYWQAFDDYYEDLNKYTRKLRASGIEPLTYSQQELRYVKRWVGPPLFMDEERCKTAAVFSFLHRIHPDNINALLDGRLDIGHTCDSKDCWSIESYDETSSLLAEYSIDHIIPASRGGHNNRLNYFLMPLAINSYFADRWTAEKVAYIGLNAALEAGSQYYNLGFDHDRQRRCKLLHRRLH